MEASHRIILAALLVVVGFSIAAAADPAPAAKPGAVAWTRDGVTMKVLDNGLTVVLQENHMAPVAALRIYVETGSMYEEEYLGAGISHIFEHLISGGTTSTRSETESTRILDRIGGQDNAYTTVDHTCYHASTLAENLPTLIDLMADWMKNSTFPQAEYEREMKVVNRELEMRRDNPQTLFYQASVQNAFRVHPCRLPVIGYKELLAKITRDDIVTYYKRHYTPNKMIVAAAGDFDAKETLAIVEKAFADFKRHAEPLVVLPEEPRQVGRRYVERAAPVKRASMMMAFHTVPLQHPDLYPLDIISYVLSWGDSSRLVRRLREEDQLVYSIDTWSYTPHYGCGRFVVSMNLPYENIHKAERAVLEELDRLKREPVTAAELARAKKQKVADDVFGAQTVEDQAANLGYNVMAVNDPFFDRTYVTTIQKVTAAELMPAAKRYFRPENLSVTVLRPVDAKAAVDETAAPAEPAAFKRFVLPNGLVVLLKRNPGPKLVSVQAYFWGGVRSETDADNGVCNLTGGMLVKGTKLNDAATIARYFDSIGGSIGGGGGRNSFYLTAQMLSDDFEDAIRVYADCLKNPTFPEAELDKLRERALAGIDQINDDPYREASLAFQQAFFTKSRYRSFPIGTRKAVEGLTRADLAAYHRQHVAGKNGVLAVYGEIDMAKAEGAIRAAFADLPTGAPTRTPPVVEAPIRKDVVITKHTDKKQAVVMFGFRGMTIDNAADRMPAVVLDAVVSGMNLPGGWLHTDLRGAGLVYAVHAFNWTQIDPGYFGGYAICQPDKADEVVRRIRAHLDRAKTADIPPDELARAKRMVITAFVLDRQTNEAVALKDALLELYGTGLEFDRKYIQRVNAVTVEDIHRVAKKYLTNWLVLVARPKPAASAEKAQADGVRNPGGS